MNKTKKVAISCVISAIFCTVITLYFAPMLWWLGIPAGLAGGYLSYEFRDVLKAIPIAFRAAYIVLIATLIISFSGLMAVFDSVCRFFSKQHPHLYSTIIMTLPMAWVCIWGYYHAVILHPYYKIHVITDGDWGAFYIVSFMGFILVFLINIFLIAGVATLGMYKLKECDQECWLDGEAIETNISRGFIPLPLTYRNMARWLWKGTKVISESVALFVLKAIGYSLVFCFWYFWKYLGIALWAIARFVGTFIKTMFVLIHSSERVLCAIDGTIGGVVSYLLLYSSEMMLEQKVIMVIFGGLMGAVLGVLNYEVVSKRLLRLPVNNRPA